jgi:hypothetical protein
MIHYVNVIKHFLLIGYGAVQGPSEEFENSPRQYSSLGKLTFYNFLYYGTKTVNIP